MCVVHFFVDIVFERWESERENKTSTTTMTKTMAMKRYKEEERRKNLFGIEFFFFWSKDDCVTVAAKLYYIYCHMPSDLFGLMKTTAAMTTPTTTLVMTTITATNAQHK